ncbi:MAG: helix-turn-helix domain-containing protein [Betaproteobacteria bacterium]|nr:helix-turn-helix domain-containing protein [Betaproteobacteria bacterium]
MELHESSVVMARLNISSQRLGRLVKDGRLQCIEHSNQLGNRRVFERGVVDTFCAQYRENAGWMRIEDAAKYFDVSPQGFRRNWTDSGRLKTETDGLGTYLRVEDVDVAIKQNRTQLTARQASQLIGIEKSTLANCHQLGRIRPISGPGIDQFGTYLYDRTSVLALRQYNICQESAENEKDKA